MGLPYENTTAGDKAGVTHCKWGHPFDENNTRIANGENGRKRRQCRACQRIRAAGYYEVSRQERLVARLRRIEEWKREISDSDLAWAAGHFEGEGTISISAERRNGYARPLVSLASTDRQIIELFSSWWPPSSKRKPRIPTENSRPVYRWEINSAGKVRAFIDQIRPHLRTERCAVKFDLVSEFVDLILAPHTGKEKPRYPEYIEQIRRLNHRGSKEFALAK